MHIDSENKDILNLGEGPSQRLVDTTLTADTKYPINFTQSGKRFVSSLFSNGSSSFLFVTMLMLMLQRYITSMQKTLK